MRNTFTILLLLAGLTGTAHAMEADSTDVALPELPPRPVGLAPT